MKTFKPEELTTKQAHSIMLGSVNPRPICFASTLDKNGNPNLAPYSFFNVFSSLPPILVFSVNNRRDGSAKHTLENIKQTGEVVINMVSYQMSRQMAICGVEFEKEINEFEKGGFTPIHSQIVKPWRVKESPIQFECEVMEIKSLGNDGGSANMIFAKALLIHINEKIINSQSIIDPHETDMVGRLGNTNYCRASGSAVFSIEQPPSEIVIGFDNLPQSLRESKILTGNMLAKMAGVTYIPQIDNIYDCSTQVREFAVNWKKTDGEDQAGLHNFIKMLLDKEDTTGAWQVFQLCSKTTT